MNKTNQMNQIRQSRLSRSSVLDSLRPMAPSPQHSGRKLSHKPSFFLALLCLIGTACGTTAPTGKIIFDDPRGTVSLQTISDRSIQASHPINLDPALLALVLQGIEIQDQEHGLQKMLAGPAAPVPVFSDDQIRFLAPLLTEGLRTAAPDQAVEYRVQTTHTGSFLASSTTETTAGSLYAYGRQLYVTLSQYRYNPMRTNMNLNDMASRSRQADSSGLRDRTLLFTPKTAQRSDSFDPPPLGKPTDRFLAVDYQLLQQASPAIATTGQAGPQDTSGASAQAAQAAEALAQREKDLAQRETTLAQREADIQRLKDIVNKNVSEVETMRKELQSVQEQLESQPTSQDSQKGKTTAPSKPQQTAP